MESLIYLAEKVALHNIVKEPFPHIFIKDFLAPDDFKAVVEDEQIGISAQNAGSLIGALSSKGWKPRPFGGCTTDVDAYLRWRRDPNKGFENSNTCSGFGLAFSLDKPHNQRVALIKDYLGSQEFFDVLLEKFGIERQSFRIAAGLHKYLTGYEISPHPDSRAKALTYMLNVNPGMGSERNLHHTQYMRLRDERSYISEFWKGNQSVDRSWLPWDWCETIFEQSANNSLVCFSPCDTSIHAIRAIYDDLQYQRTQFYGNLWYEDCPSLIRPSWEFLDIRPVEERKKASFAWKAKNLIRRKTKNWVRGLSISSR